MKESENIDDIFSEALSNFGVEPPENLQESIAGKRKNIEPEEGGNGRNYLFIIIGAMILLFAALFFVSNEQHNIAEAKNKINYKSKVSIADSSNKAIELLEKPLSENNNSTQIIASNSFSQKDTNELINDSYVRNSDTKTNQKSSNAKSKEGVKKNKTRLKKLLKTNSSISNSSFQNDVQKDSQSNLVSKAESQFDSLNQLKLIRVDAPIDLTYERNDTVISKEINSSTMIVADSLKTSLLDSLKATNNLLNQENKDDLAPNKIKTIWFIEPMVGINFSQNKFSSDNKIALNLLKDSVKIVQPGMAYTINVGIQKNKLMFKSGIGIQQWSEQLGNSYITQKYVAAIGDSIIINGTDTIVKHNIPIQILADVHSANSNKTSYTFINLPLIVGYSTKFNKLELNCNFGFIYSLLLNSKGNYLHLTTKSATNYSRKQDAPLNTQRVMILLSVDALYAINERSKLVVSLPLNIALTSHYSNEYAIKRRMNNLGINLGYRYTF